MDGCSGFKMLKAAAWSVFLEWMAGGGGLEWWRREGEG